MPFARTFLQVGPWSSCSGDAGFGHSNRDVSCVDASGQPVTAGPDTCASQPPITSALCQTEASTTACMPETPRDKPSSVDTDCSGHARCRVSGCECKDGWHGQFCEVPPKCAGVMDRRDVCCASGVLDVSGDCCSPGSVLGASGACCGAGQVDVCGVCGGSSWTVDVRVSAAHAYTCCVGGWVGGVAWEPFAHKLDHTIASPNHYGTTVSGLHTVHTVFQCAAHHTQIYSICPMADSTLAPSSPPLPLCTRVCAVPLCWTHTACAAHQVLLTSVGCVTGMAPAAACTSGCCCS
jgi:hypothetical protein